MWKRCLQNLANVLEKIKEMSMAGNKRKMRDNQVVVDEQSAVLWFSLGVTCKRKKSDEEVLLHSAPSHGVGAKIWNEDGAGNIALLQFRTI